MMRMMSSSFKKGCGHSPVCPRGMRIVCAKGASFFAVDRRRETGTGENGRGGYTPKLPRIRPTAKPSSSKGSPGCTKIGWKSGFSARSSIWFKWR